MEEVSKYTVERPSGVEFRLNIDGSENPKYVDLLDEDRSVAEQKFTCISFISPEKIIKQREMYMFNEFLKQWDMNKSLEKFNQFMNFVSYKYNLKSEQLTNDLQEFVKEEKDNLFKTTLEDEYKDYLDINEKILEEKFNIDNNFHTSIRGIKVRGSYPTLQEAELRCKMLREVDPHHDVYVGPVGVWMPFHPEAYKTGRMEYIEDELNQLMHEKVKNETQAKQEFDKRVKDAKMKAMEDNRKKAAESGNLLTQTINENGDLISVANMNTSEGNLNGNGNVSLEEVRKELFEGDNIVTDTNNDHGLSELGMNQNQDEPLVEENKD